jgi:hypothetical protein
MQRYVIDGYFSVEPAASISCLFSGEDGSSMLLRIISIYEPKNKVTYENTVTLNLNVVTVSNFIS